MFKHKQLAGQEQKRNKLKLEQERTYRCYKSTFMSPISLHFIILGFPDVTVEGGPHNS